MIHPEYTPVITWFPCYLNLINQFPGVWEVYPGLCAGPISDAEKTTLRQCAVLPGVKESFEPNFLVIVDESAYLTALAERLGITFQDLKGSLTLKTSDSSRQINIIPDELFRWIIVSLYLCYDLDIYLPSFRYQFKHEIDSLVPFGAGPTHAGFQRSIYTNVSYHDGLVWPIDFKMVQQIAEQIEAYYRPVNWQYDPISVALSCFWSATYSIFPDQAYVSLVTILEALLSTGTAEISHQISERVAILIGFGQDERLEIYKKVKKLYDLRSRIAHGDLSVTKGPVNWNSSIISAKTTIISMPELTKMAQVVTSVIRRILEVIILRDALQQSNKQKRKDSMDNYFLSQLFHQSTLPHFKDFDLNN